MKSKGQRSQITLIKFKQIQNTKFSCIVENIDIISQGKQLNGIIHQ